MDIIQSTILTLARVPLNTFEQRIVIKLVEHSQSYFAKLKRNVSLAQTFPRLSSVIVKIPLCYLVGEKSHNYTPALAAAASLCKKVWQVYQPETKSFQGGSIIQEYRYREGTGVLEVKVSEYFYLSLFNLTAGYKKYDLETSLALSSPYAVRMYQILCNQQRPISFTIDNLKKMFGVQNKYKQTADFIKKVIRPSQKALDEAGVNSFRYSKITKGQKITHIEFIPVKRDKAPEQLSAVLSRDSIVSYKAVQIYLREVCGFTLKECSVQQSVLVHFATLPDCIQRLRLIADRATKKEDFKAYVIGSMKAEIKSYDGQPR